MSNATLTEKLPQRAAEPAAAAINYSDVNDLRAVVQASLREELYSATVEPLLPIEKKLIGWSLTIGLVLLAVLAAIKHFVPMTF